MDFNGRRSGCWRAPCISRVLIETQANHANTATGVLRRCFWLTINWLRVLALAPSIQSLLAIALVCAPSLCVFNMRVYWIGRLMDVWELADMLWHDWGGE